MERELLPAGLMQLIKAASRQAVLALGAAGASGPERVRELTGHSKGTVSRWQGDAYGECMPLEVAFQLEFLSQQPIFARALAQLTGHRLVPIDAAAAASEMVSDLVEVTATAAGVTAELGLALSDGQVTPAEARAIERAVGPHQKALTALQRKLAAVRPREG